MANAPQKPTAPTDPAPVQSTPQTGAPTSPVPGNDPAPNPPVNTPTPNAGGPTIVQSPQGMAEGPSSSTKTALDAIRRRMAARDTESGSIPAGFRMGRTVDDGQGDDVTLGQFVSLFQVGIGQIRGFDFWGALATASKLLNGLSHLGLSQNTVPPMAMATPEHAAEHDAWDKCLQEFAAVKGQAVNTAAQWSGNPGHMMAGGPQSGAAAGLAGPDPRTVGFNPANILLLIQVFQTVADFIQKFRNRK